MLAHLRDQDTALFLILFQTTVKQVLPVLWVHVLCEQGENGTARSAAGTFLF